MKKGTIPAILFFGTCWGACEVFGGEALYRAQFPYASVPLSIAALGILSLGRAYFPRPGSSLAIGCVAAIYKLLAMYSGFVGTPVFACHLLGICFLGATYDVLFSALPTLNKSACAAAVTYTSYVLFALSITYLFRYAPWVAGGLGRIVRHILLSGTLTAVGGAIVVPGAFRLAGALEEHAARPAPVRSALTAGGLYLITAVLWAAGILAPL
ncbi:MAG: hypothetical protein KAX78_10010 [Phycisphaerae bacterium]|nr:hypothetical protein [Phycisphaerae bacterium]